MFAMHNVFIQSYASAVVGTALSPITLCFVNLSCLCLAVSAACRTSLFSLSCDDFRALLEIFRIYMFTTAKQLTIKACACVSQLDHAHIVSVHGACTRALDVRHMIHIYIYIY